MCVPADNNWITRQTARAAASSAVEQPEKVKIKERHKLLFPFKVKDYFVQEGFCCRFVSLLFEQERDSYFMDANRIVTGPSD